MTLRNMAFAPALDDEWQWIAQGGGNDAALAWLAQWWEWEGQVYQAMVAEMHESTNCSSGLLRWERLPISGDQLLDWDVAPGAASGAMHYLGEALPNQRPLRFTWRIRCGDLPMLSMGIDLHCLARRLPENYARLGGESQTYFFKMCLLARK